MVPVGRSGGLVGARLTVFTREAESFAYISDVK